MASVMDAPECLHLLGRHFDGLFQDNPVDGFVARGGGQGPIVCVVRPVGCNNTPTINVTITIVIFNMDKKHRFNMLSIIGIN